MSYQSALEAACKRLDTDLYESGYRPLPIDSDEVEDECWEKPMGYSILSFDGDFVWTHYSCNPNGDRIAHSTREFDYDDYMDAKITSLADWLAQTEHELYKPVAAQPVGPWKNRAFSTKYEDAWYISDHIRRLQTCECKKCNTKLTPYYAQGSDRYYRHKCKNKNCSLFVA